MTITLDTLLYTTFDIYSLEKDKKDGLCSANPYSFDQVFSGAANNGFKFMYTGNADPGGNPLWSKDRQRAEAQTSIISAQGNSCNFPSNYLGVFACSWDQGGYNKDATIYNGYTTFELMAKDNREECCQSRFPFFPLNDWTIGIDTTKWYRVVFNHSNLCLRPTNAQLGNNIQLEQWTIDNNDNTQLWKFKKAFPGYYYPVNYYGSSFTIAGTALGSYLNNSSLVNGLNQQFRFISSPIAGNYYMADLQSASQRSAITTLTIQNSSTARGAKLITATIKTTGYQNQIVQLVEAPDPNLWYRMTFMHSGMSMRPTGAVPGNNIPIEQSVINANDSTQWWKFINAGSGYYYPINTNGKTIDIYGSSSGALVRTWDLASGTNQQYRFDVCPKTGYYYMVDKRSASAGTNFALSVQSASTAAGAKVLTGTKNTTGYESQVVKLEAVTFLPQGEIATGINNDGRVYCFARGKDNNIYYRLQQTINGVFSNHWTYLAGPSYGGNIAVGKIPGGKLFVFYRGANNQICYCRQITVGIDSWQTCMKLPVTKDLIVSGKIQVTIGNSQDKFFLDVLARSALDTSMPPLLRVWEQSMGTDDDWFSPFCFNAGGGWEIDSNIAAINSPDNLCTYVFAIRNDNHTVCYSRVCQGGLGIGMFSVLPGIIADHYKLPSHNIEAAINTDGRCEVFVDLPNSSIWHNYEITPGGNWAGWSSVINPSWGNSHFKIGKNSSGALEIFTVSYQNTFGHMWQNSQVGYGWEPINTPSFIFDASGNSIRVANENPAISMMQNRSLIAFVFVTGNFSTPDWIYTSNQLPTGMWSAWVPFTRY